ncbi:hypothetical protein ABFS82_13G171100 [Erythranthe guttata]|uniref:F-box domain-containing protein n=1 Tax=Erythranthe guttata TaxID=4155 RepID=A0A022PSA8_ERYGU|nr:PREDICTED: putative F-box/LRR-repeat protein At1g56400 [Erythranthe guttata]EYU19237.1 hypothetical protein MIMGU_mgv1a019995mg [Erythranthe guttata]|eukprot:XP_012827401.1 PREDICTED: putative F-box/LRR-repeat protein At1g56400 [Erythranthe guttata]
MDRNDSVDRFSFLPDALILIIITCLPFKEAVKTSVLSKRWLRLWQSTGNIDLDENFFVKAGSSGETRATQRSHFVAFLRFWTENYTEPKVKKYRFVYSNSPDFHLPAVQHCIKFAVDHRELTSLDLDFSDPDWDEEDISVNPQTPPHLPAITLDKHAVLNSLRLSACNFRVPQSITFSGLKNVCLAWMKIPGSSLYKFLKLCPSLETLILRRIWNVGSFDIEAPNLKFLVLDKLSGPEFISVSAPSLSFFQYSGLSVYLQMEYNRTMTEAIFDFSLQPTWDEEGDPEMLYNLLSEVWSVKVLTVCSYMLQVVPMAENSLSLQPRLENVTRLVLKTQLHIQEYYGITFFLNSCPRLEVLSIDIGPKKIFEDWRPPYGMREHPFSSNLWYPACVESTLKKIEVKGFKGDDNEITVLRYLLKYGKVLRHLHIGLSKERGADGIDMESTYRENIQKLMDHISSPHLQVYVV